MTPEIEISDQNFIHLGRFEGPFLTTLGVKKVVFWTFSKLDWKCLGNVRGLFSAINSPFLGIFSLSVLKAHL